MFDSNRLRAELTHIQRALGNVAASPRGKGLLDELRRSTRGTSAARLWQALYADCMRIVHAAVAADGVIDDHELEEFHDVLSTAARSYVDTLMTEYAELIVIDVASARRFVTRYAEDRGPFGRHAEVAWPGLALCRRASEIGDGAALAQYERTMTWLIAEACRIGGVSSNDPRCRGRLDELDQLRRSLARDAVVEAPGLDLRLRAFLSPAWVFTAVQQASSVFENDPFDIESIHRHARESFERMIEHARMPSQIAGGRILLIAGDSGGGKTHLLRDFRRQVQENGRGFVVYAQLQSNADDYERYLLQHLVDSLARPYSAASGERTGLRELASGMVRLVSGRVQGRVQQLCEGTWDGRSLTDTVYEIVDDMVREGKFAAFDLDLLRVLLFALCPDPLITASVYKYLRCEEMNPRDRMRIGDAIPRTGRDHPHLMFRELGRLAAMTQRALVVMVDQVDLTGFEQSSSVIFRRAIDALYRITSEISSAVAVVACLKDLYNAVRSTLNQPAIDRLERNPPIAWLESNCSYAQIEEVVSRRLEWLFDSHGAVFRPEEPIYPIPEAQLRELDNRRLRDVLQWCHEFQTRCAMAGRIVNDDCAAMPVLPRDPQEDLDRIAAMWNDESHAQGLDVPTDEDEILKLIGAAARACAEESGLAISPPVIQKSLLRMSLSTGQVIEELAVMVTNQNYHGGAFTGRIENLRKRAKDAIAIAVRTLEFPRGEACDRAISQLVKDGGRRALLDESTLRALVAFERFQPPFPEERIRAWQRRDQPISGSPTLVAMFGLERLRTALPIDALADAPDRAAQPAAAVSTPVVDVASSPLTNVPETRAGGAAQPKKRAAMTPPVGVPKPLPEPQTVPVPPIVSRVTPSTGTVVQAAASAEPQVVSARQSSPRLEQSGPPPTAGNQQTSTKLLGSMPDNEIAASRASADLVVASRPPQGTRPPAIATNKIWVGNSPAFDAEPRVIEVAAMLTHVAIVGDERPHNTALVLSLIEQLVARDVAAIIVDRNGDLAGHAQSDWWQRSQDPERARALAAKLDVRLFTPGRAAGCPLALPVAPDLANVAEPDRERVVQRAARGLAAIMQFGDGTGDAARLAVLTQAIAVLATRPMRGGLAELIALIDQQDDALVARAARAGCYDAAVFKRLVQELQSIQVSDAALFDPAADILGLGALVGGCAPGKVPLVIVNTQSLGATSRIQAWIAHLLACLVSRPGKRDELSTLLVLDDAELFLPATGKAASKEPLRELLKSPHSAGLGVVLMSQRPAELDHRSRELIYTWFLGRMQDAKINDRLNQLFDRLPPIRSKLAGLERSRFVMLQDRATVAVERASPLVRGESLADTELIALAASTRAPARRAPDGMLCDDPDHSAVSRTSPATGWAH